MSKVAVAEKKQTPNVVPKHPVKSKIFVVFSIKPGKIEEASAALRNIKGITIVDRKESSHNAESGITVMIESVDRMIVASIMMNAIGSIETITEDFRLMVSL